MSYQSSNGLPLRAGVIYGIAAFLGGTLLTFILATVGLMGRMGAFMVGFLPLRGSAILYIAFHIWPLSGGASMGSLAIWTIVPMLVLIPVGFYVADNNGGGFEAGASIAAGYLIMIVATFLLFMGMAAGMGGRMNVGASGLVNFLLAVVLAGIVFPVIFGGIGGALAN